MFLRSSGGRIDPEVDVFIDLTGRAFLDRSIPHQIAHLFPKPGVIIMPWEVTDGTTCEQITGMVVTLLENKYKVGWGCVGGHGRTGWLAASVLKALTGCTGNDAVTYVRDHYCEKAIETQEQLDFLGSNLFL